MTRINTNVASLRGLRSMNRANDLLSTSLTRLSTGLKINSGRDEPAGLIASEALRSQITTIEQSITNSNRANNVISTADSALGEIGGLLNQIRGLVQEGLNSGALSQTEIEANQLQIDAALSAINRISANTKFAGDKLIDGSKAFVTQMSTADVGKLSDLQINEALFGSNATIDIAATVENVAKKGELRYAGGDLSEAATLEISGSKGSQVLFMGQSSSVADVRDAVNSVTDVTGVVASTLGELEVGGGATAAELAFDAVDAVQASKLFEAAGSGGEVTVTAAEAGAAGNDLQVEFVEGDGNNVALSAAIDGNVITVTLATDGSGDLDDDENTAENIAAAIDALDEVSAVETEEGDSFGAATAENLEDGADAETITFTAVETGAAGNNITIEFVQGDDEDTSVEVDDDDPDNITITFTLADDDGDITETVDGLVAFLESEDGAEAAAYITASGSGETAIANTGLDDALEGGADGTGGVTFTDIREAGSEGTISVVFADPDENDAELSIEVSEADESGNQTITVNLATDEDGEITTTAADIVAAIEADEVASELVSAEEHDEGVVRAADEQTLDEELVLTSENFGSNQFVDVSVLNGSFDTTLADGTTHATRSTGEDIGVVINGQTAEGKGLQASVKTATLDAALTFVEGSNVEDEQTTVTITGGGSLFQIGQDVSAAGQIGLGIEAVNTARLGGVSGKVFELGSGAGKSLLDVGPDVQGSQLVGIIDDAISRVSTLRGRLGAVQKNVIETNVTTLGVALENITQARSEIIDTDFAVETANLTKAQILSQAGLSVLSIANQNPAQVLSLLG